MFATADQSKTSSEKIKQQAIKRWGIDKIIVRVNGANILQSDIEQPRIAKEGQPYTLDEAIMEELLVQRAAEMHMLPNTVEIDRQLVAFKIQNNLTEMSDREFEEELQRNGFTIKTYKNQLGRLIAAENIKRAEISEKIVVTSQDVEEYYKKHPERTQEEYHLVTCTLTQEQIENKKAYLASDEVAWEDLGWIAKKDLGKKFNVVYSMKKGDLSEPIKLGNTYQVIKLLDKREKRLKTLDERYADIERTLQLERKEKFIGQFEKELKTKASIINL